MKKIVRYIDAEQAIHLIENDALSQVYYRKSDAIDCIKATPTADVVEVVRCKDCKYFSEFQYCGVLGFCEPNEYCSRGERRKGDG